MSYNKGLGFYDENGIVFQENEEKHITENIKRILTTRRGTRVGDLAFGSDVMRFIFMPEMSIDDLLEEVKNSIARCEPRVTVIEASLIRYEEDMVEINLVVRINSSDKVIETNIQVV